jgi:hypothetical protein
MPAFSNSDWSGIPGQPQKYGLNLIIMALVFAASTILVLHVLCVCSTSSLQCTKPGALKRYGEVLGGGRS